MNALIIDTHELYRLSIKEIIAQIPHCQPITEASSEQEILTLTSKKQSFELIVMTPQQFGEDGMKWLHLARRLYAKAAILIFYNRETSPMLPQSDEKCEILPKDASVQHIFATIRRLLKLPQQNFQGLSKKITDNVKHQIVKKPTLARPSQQTLDIQKLSRLSYRQKQILSMAANGLPNKEIAAQLTIAEGTVKAHMHSIFKVLSVTNRTQAVLYFSALQHNTKHHLSAS